MAEQVELARHAGAGDVVIDVCQRAATFWHREPGDEWLCSLAARQAVGHEYDIGRRMRLAEVAALAMGGVAFESQQALVVGVTARDQRSGPPHGITADHYRRLGLALR